jgi:hypothetical protein
MNIEFAISEAVLENELENFTTHIAGEVFEHDDNGNKIVYAHIEASRVDVGNVCNDQEDIKHVFWRGSHELRHVYEAFYVQDSSEFQYLDKELDWNWASESTYRNILLIELVTVAPPHRGQCLGLKTIYRTIQRLAGGSMLVILDVRPLQYRSNYLNLDKLELNRFKGSSEASLKGPR